MKCKTMQGLQGVASNQMTSDDEEEHSDGGVGLGGRWLPHVNTALVTAPQSPWQPCRLVTCCWPGSSGGIAGGGSQQVEVKDN